MNEKEIKLRNKWTFIGFFCGLFVLFLTMNFYETNIIPEARADALAGYSELWYKACELNDFEDLEHSTDEVHRMWDCSQFMEVVLNE